uniref:RING-type domain-containing protein n=1 Tax=Dicentrarchus labrax TaxID=13489 RepID=A0A8C4DL35_DICLA
MGSKLSTKRKRRHQSESERRRVSAHGEGFKGLRGRFVDEEDECSSEEESSSSRTVQEKCYDPLDPTFTFVDEEDDLDFLCNEYLGPRAKMSCGHAVTPMSLTDWCCWLLDQGECRFVCGQTDCDVEWPFEEVCKMALLSPEELEYFEKKIFNNAAKDYLDVKEVSITLFTKDFSAIDIYSVKCSVCTANRRRSYIFCWQCLKKWKGPAPRSDRCGNDDCQNPLEILKTCPDIVFEDVEGVTGCPSIRACPTCGLLLEHNKTQCKNIVCRRCKVEFCFVCLKTTEECQELTDEYEELTEESEEFTDECEELTDESDEEDVSSYYGLCSTGVAPRQTSIPVWQRT